MKYAIPFIMLGLLAATACQDQTKKPAASSSVTDLSASTQASYTPPVQTVTPDPVLASTASPTLSVAAPGSSNSYTIKHGDTLWKIAMAHYGDGKQYHKILDANPGLDPSKLKVGQTITLP